jgi:transposase
MSFFPTAKEPASWAGQCPGNDQSAGKRRSHKTRNGSNRLDWRLEEAALAATRSKDTYPAAQYARRRPRRGHKKALGAVKHSLLVACCPAGVSLRSGRRQLPPRRDRARG